MGAFLIFGWENDGEHNVKRREELVVDGRKDYLQKRERFMRVFGKQLRKQIVLEEAKPATSAKTAAKKAESSSSESSGSSSDSGMMRASWTHTHTQS